MIPKHRNKHTHTKSQSHSNTRISLNILFCYLPVYCRDVGILREHVVSCTLKLSMSTKLNQSSFGHGIL